MRRILVMVLLLLVASCSTLRKTIIYSALSGGVAGATTGKASSPNRASDGGNVVLFGLGGAAIAAGIGYALYRDDPRNYKLKHMLLGKNLDLEVGDLEVHANLDQQKTYHVPLIPLPEKLKEKVGKQYLIEHRAREQFIKKGKKTFYIPSFNVFEHSYSEIGGSNE